MLGTLKWGHMRRLRSAEPPHMPPWSTMRVRPGTRCLDSPRRSSVGVGRRILPGMVAKSRLSVSVTWKRTLRKNSHFGQLGNNCGIRTVFQGKLRKTSLHRAHQILVSRVDSKAQVSLVLLKWDRQSSFLSVVGRSSVGRCFFLFISLFSLFF